MSHTEESEAISSQLIHLVLPLIPFSLFLSLSRLLFLPAYIYTVNPFLPGPSFLPLDPPCEPAGGGEEGERGCSSNLTTSFTHTLEQSCSSCVAWRGGPADKPRPIYLLYYANFLLARRGEAWRGGTWRGVARSFCFCFCYVARPTDWPTGLLPRSIHEDPAPRGRVPRSRPYGSMSRTCR